MSESNLILYTTPNRQVSVQVQYEDGNFWLTQKRMSELFEIESHTIAYRLKEIYQSSELQVDSTIRKIRVVQQEGKLKAEQEFETYRKVQDENYISDFDREIKRIQGKSCTFVRDMFY